MSCTCQRCGNKFKVDVMVPDEIWFKIRPRENSSAGLLCGCCIIKSIEKYYGHHAVELKSIP